MTEPVDPLRMLEQARSAIGPSEADRVRVEAALEQRLDALTTGPGGGDGGAGASGSPGALAQSGWLPAAGATAGVVALATAAALWWPTGSTPTPTTPSASQEQALAATPEPRRAAQPGAATEAGESVKAAAMEANAIARAEPEAETATPTNAVVHDANADDATKARDAARERGAAVGDGTATRSSEDSTSGAPVARRDGKAAARDARTGSKAGARAARGDEPTRASATSAAEPRAKAATEARAAVAAQAEPTNAAKPSEDPIPAPEQQRDYLMAELTLIDNASRALGAARPAVAMDYLERHRELYGRGTLGTEREALTALALCDLGKTSAARKRAAAFLRRHPTSPLTARVRRAADCAPR